MFAKRPDESGRCRHECLRHEGLPPSRRNPSGTPTGDSAQFFEILRRLFQLTYTFFRCQAQLADEESQIDTVFLCGFDAASWGGVAQALRGPFELFRRQCSKFPHSSSLPPVAGDILLE